MYEQVTKSELVDFLRKFMNAVDCCNRGTLVRFSLLDVNRTPMQFHVKGWIDKETGTEQVSIQALSRHNVKLGAISLSRYALTPADMEFTQWIDNMANAAVSISASEQQVRQPADPAPDSLAQRMDGRTGETSRRDTTDCKRFGWYSPCAGSTILSRTIGISLHHL